jgi:hypothetical protein
MGSDAEISQSRRLIDRRQPDRREQAMKKKRVNTEDDSPGWNVSKKHISPYMQKLIEKRLAEDKKIIERANERDRKP